ncbi:hypothetical protein EVAR_47777_1 [Eumeta japonica]|uniref:Uncharacterized protein n=1 Tax=Eumeta variegata TaxID=151549 RepID=A0A4C1XTB9_EUMVA|nr:hypothetical protein EVAR_47777_1 [Eumeta japonica]
MEIGKLARSSFGDLPESIAPSLEGTWLIQRWRRGLGSYMYNGHNKLGSALPITIFESNISKSRVRRIVIYLVSACVARGHHWPSIETSPQRHDVIQISDDSPPDVADMWI